MGLEVEEAREPAVGGRDDTRAGSDMDVDPTPPDTRYPSRHRTQTERMNIKHPEDYSNTKSYSGDTADGVIHATVADEISADFEQGADLEYVLGVALVQTFNLKQGLKLFGKRAEDATTKEFTQLHDTEAFVPLDASTLSQRGDALPPCWHRLSAGIASMSVRTAGLSTYTWPSTHMTR